LNGGRPVPKGDPVPSASRARDPFVGSRAVRSQTELRPCGPVRDLDEFLAFLRRLQKLFGPVDRPRRPTTGDRFLL
jgi:hypothetical protein